MKIDERINLIVGDCVESMKLIEDQSVQTCITSPPYFGLRDYGHKGQIGLEQTPDEYVARLVEVFREVRRVLRDDGTRWLNLGDSYAAARGGTHQPAETLAGGEGGKTKEGKRVNRDRHDGYNPSRNASGIGLKHKDLIGIPWRVAFALQADGWYLRQDIIWHKPNPMPESVTDRCTKAHEYLFLLSKSARYYFDAKAIKEGSSKESESRYKSAFSSYSGGIVETGSQKKGKNTAAVECTGKRNKRSVWTVTTKPYSGAHFAVFPPDLIEPCVLAGSKPEDVVLDPFGGSGTTAGVALKHDRLAAICELNPEYAAMISDRVKKVFPDVDQRSLFE